MKQYKLIIKENCKENIGGILNSQAKSGWKLNSYESNGDIRKSEKSRVVLIFEKG